MKIPSKLLAAAAPLALLMLGACATPFTAKVARFQSMPAPAGQSFVIQPLNPRDQGGLEFAQYAALVSQRLTQLGYRAAASPQDATFVVTLGYGVDHGQQHVETLPGAGFGPWGGYGPWGYGGYGGWGGWGRGRFGYSPFFYGWGDPWAFGGFGYPDVESYTVYTSHLDMTIARTADGQHLFEGHARAHSTTDDLTKLVPDLVQAMFTGFPGHSGEDVRITVPPPPRHG